MMSGNDQHRFSVDDELLELSTRVTRIETSVLGLTNSLVEIKELIQSNTGTNYNLWAILVAAAISIISAGYWTIYSPLKAENSAMQTVVEKDLAHQKEILDLKVELIECKHGKN